MSKSYRHSKTGRHEKVFKYKRVKLTKHHLTPKERMGTGEPSNILMLWRDRHDYFHKIFGNRTLEELIAVLQRIARMKGRDCYEAKMV